MDQSKMFRALIVYLKAGCATLVIMSVAGIALLRVAPFFTLEQLIFLDWYGRPTLPPDAVRPFELCYLLFAWLSVLSGVTLYYTVQHGLRFGERWAYHCYLTIGVFWPLGAIGIALYTTAYWYLLSASIMALMFVPPVFLLRPFIGRAPASLASANASRPEPRIAAE